MTDAHIAEAQLYAYAHRLFQDHEKLLDDLHRNQPFYQALEKQVTPMSSVLDIGSGTGIWAIAAAMLGAKRVVAIEQDPLLMGLIKTLARENGVADKINVVAGDSRQVNLGKDFDIVITETIGNLGFDEQIVSITQDARARFLKPGGVLIPETLALLAAPAHLAPPQEGFPAGVPVSYRFFADLALNIPVGLTPDIRIRLLKEAQVLIDVNLNEIDAEPDLQNLTAQWSLADAHAVNCFVVWATSNITEGVSLTTQRTSSWSPLLYRIQPFDKAAGTLRFMLKLTGATNYWTARLSVGDDHQERSYSPAYAAEALLGQPHTAADLSKPVP